MPGTSFKESGAFFGTLTLTEDMLRDLDALTGSFTTPKRAFVPDNDAQKSKLSRHSGWFDMEAGNYNVFRSTAAAPAFRGRAPQLTKDRKTYVYYPHTQMIPENVAAKLLNKSHSLTAEVEIPKGGAEGVLICHGGNVGGYTLFVKDRSSTMSTTTSARRNSMSRRPWMCRQARFPFGTSSRKPASLI